MVVAQQKEEQGRQVVEGAETSCRVGSGDSCLYSVRLKSVLQRISPAETMVVLVEQAVTPQQLHPVLELWIYLLPWPASLQACRPGVEALEALLEGQGVLVELLGPLVDRLAAGQVGTAFLLLAVVVLLVGLPQAALEVLACLCLMVVVVLGLRQVQGAQVLWGLHARLSGELEEDQSLLQGQGASSCPPSPELVAAVPRHFQDLLLLLVVQDPQLLLVVPDPLLLLVVVKGGLGGHLLPSLEAQVEQVLVGPWRA